MAATGTQVHKASVGRLVDSVDDPYHLEKVSLKRIDSSIESDNCLSVEPWNVLIKLMILLTTDLFNGFSDFKPIDLA